MIRTFLLLIMTGKVDHRDMLSCKPVAGVSNTGVLESSTDEIRVPKTIKHKNGRLRSPFREQNPRACRTVLLVLSTIHCLHEDTVARVVRQSIGLQKSTRPMTSTVERDLPKRHAVLVCR